MSFDHNSCWAIQQVCRQSLVFSRRLPTFVTVMGAPCRLPISVRLLAKQSSIMDIWWDGGKKDKSSGDNSIDILGLAQFRAQVMFGVLRHVSTSSALVLNSAQNAAQFRAQFCAQVF